MLAILNESVHDSRVASLKQLPQEALQTLVVTTCDRIAAGVPHRHATRCLPSLDFFSLARIDQIMSSTVTNSSSESEDASALSLDSAQ